MGTNDELRTSLEAVRRVAGRTGGITRHERAFGRYLSAEAFETHTETAPEGWAGRPQHPTPARTNTPTDS